MTATPTAETRLILDADTTADDAQELLEAALPGPHAEVDVRTLDAGVYDATVAAHPATLARLLVARGLTARIAAPTITLTRLDTLQAWTVEVASGSIHRHYV